MRVNETQWIRAQNGKILGKRCQRTSVRKELRDAGGRLLGFYNSNTDMTCEAGGKPVVHGNQLSMFLDGGDR